MSWQLVSFLILAAVLLAGFGWYERSRPPSQVVALVAALAALAIAGRVAFAAFPNVKPTTDIVIFAGYALGPAAGFAVGAFSALISNFWFGQGPWTPWQMAAWGLCGVLGAALALGTRNVGRLTLAAVCGLAAVGYGAILNFSLMATYGSGALSWERFWLLEGRAIPFEIAHAAGNVVLALAAGPAMIRMLIRFRERFEWRREEVGTLTPGGGSAGQGGAGRIATTGRVVAVLLAVLLLGAFASTRAEAAGAQGGGTEAAVQWLRTQQNEDGGWGERGSSDQSITGWVMLGLEADGVNPQDVELAGKSPVDFLQGAISEVQSPGDLARTILALEGAGVEPREFGGRNLVAALLAKRRQDGSYVGWPNSTAYAVLALRSAGIANVSDSIGWLREVQNEDGGWGDTAGGPSNADGTGAVLQVLDPSGKAAKAAVNYLRQVQQPGGGYRLGGNGALNTQSTAWAVEGLLAAGANPAEFKRGGKSALEYLEDNQDADGHYRYSSKSDQTPVWVTGQVLVAAAKKYLPLEAPPRAPKPKVPAPAPTPTPTPTPEVAPVPTPAPTEIEPIPLPEVGGVTPTPNPTPVFPESNRAAGGSKAKHGSGGNKGKRGQKGGPGGVGATPGAGQPPTAEAPGAGAGALPEETAPLEPGADEGLAGGATEESDADAGSDGSVLGSIIAGLLVGGIVFAIGYGPYRRWKATHGKDGAQPPGADPGTPAGPDGPPTNGGPPTSAVPSASLSHGAAPSASPGPVPAPGALAPAGPAPPNGARPAPMPLPKSASEAWNMPTPPPVPYSPEAINGMAPRVPRGQRPVPPPPPSR
jgi:hypothetical protein